VKNEIPMGRIISVSVKSEDASEPNVFRKKLKYLKYKRLPKFMTTEVQSQKSFDFREPLRDIKVTIAYSAAANPISSKTNVPLAL